MADATIPSTAGVDLARRLRELRRSRFPDRSLTQLELAQALSKDEPVADSTLSSWENVRKPTLPPQSRLSAYAQFFATARSLEGKPHLVPLGELTPIERKARDDLEKELFKLRDGADGPPAGHGFWRFDDGAPITVICSDLRRSDKLELGPLSEEDNPNFGELYSYGDLDALTELYGHLRATNPNTAVDYHRRKASSELPNHLVVLGGIAWNDVTRRLNDMLTLPVRQVVDAKIHTGEIFVTGADADGGERFEPRWREHNPGTADRPGVLLEDVGMLARLPNPYNELRTLTYCNGIHSRGVLGAVRCLIDPHVCDDNERYIEESFSGSDLFVILMRVRVLGSETVSPSLKSPGTVLFQWPGDTAGK